MRKSLSRILLGGVSGVAVLIVLAVILTRAIELLNRRSDLSVTAGLVLLAAVLVIVLALVYCGVRWLLAREMREENSKEMKGEPPRALCETLFAEEAQPQMETREREPERIRKER